MERRKVYRNDPQQAAIVVTIRPVDGEAISSTLRDVSGDGLAVYAPQESGLGLYVGEEVKLELWGGIVERPITIGARLRHRLMEEDACRYGFQFVDRDSLVHVLTGKLWKLFNRRRAFRVQPHPAQPIEVALAALDDVETRAGGMLADISRFGLGVSVDLGAERAMQAVDWVEASFRLPDTSEPLEFVGLIRARNLEEEQVRYGIELSETRSENFERQQQAIEDYVIRRRREALGRMRLSG